MDDALFTSGFDAAPHRFAPLSPAALAPDGPFLPIWNDTAVCDFIGGLPAPADLAYVARCLRAHQHFAAWERLPRAPVPFYALHSSLTGIDHVGLYAGAGATEQRGIWAADAPEAPRAAWRAALAGLCEHVFVHVPAAPFVVLETRLVVPDAQDEALMLLGWEPYGAEPSRQPQRACYRLMRDVHAMYHAS